MSRMNMEQGDQSNTEQLKETASKVGKQVADVGHQVKDAAKEQYENLRNQAADYYEQGKETVEQYTDSVEHYIQEQPIKSVLIAAGVGILMGILWKRS